MWLKEAGECHAERKGCTERKLVSEYPRYTNVDERMLLMQQQRTVLQPRENLAESISNLAEMKLAVEQDNGWRENTVRRRRQRKNFYDREYECAPTHTITLPSCAPLLQLREKEQRMLRGEVLDVSEALHTS